MEVVPSSGETGSDMREGHGVGIGEVHVLLFWTILADADWLADIEAKSCE